MHTQGGTYTRRYIHKAGHTQGGTHKRRSVAVQESCYLKGVRGLAPASSAASRLHSRSGGAHTRRYIHKAGHTQGGTHKRRSVAVQECCYLKGVRGLAPASSAASRMHGRTGGAHTRRYIHKAGHTQGGTHKRRSVAVQESCYLTGVRGLAPALSAASRMHSRTGGAHTTRNIHKAVHTKGGL